MITRRKILMGGNGRQRARYLLSTSTLVNDFGEFATAVTGWGLQGIWRRDMALELAGALGVISTQSPSEEGLGRLLAGRKADTGEKWTREKREVTAVDLHAAPHKSVTVAIILAESQTERAALLQAVRQANDYAMRALAVVLGVARSGHAGSKGRIQGDA